LNGDRKVSFEDTTILYMVPEGFFVRRPMLNRRKLKAGDMAIPRRIMLVRKKILASSTPIALPDSRK
jgi:hypothetical protein